jgi:hypothetical protein
MLFHIPELFSGHNIFHLILRFCIRHKILDTNIWLLCVKAFKESEILTLLEIA